MAFTLSDEVAALHGDTYELGDDEIGVARLDSAIDGQ